VALPSALRALEHRSYRLFVGGQFLSLIGTWMQTVAQSWLVLRMTNSATALGIVGFLSQAPAAFAIPLGGFVADGFRRRNVLLVTQATSMLIAFGFGVATLSGDLGVGHVYAFVVAAGLLNTFEMPVRQAFVAEVVPKSDLPNAIALSSLVFNGARLVGPGLAGVLVAAIGEGYCFLLNGVTFIATLTCLYFVRSSADPRAGAARANRGPSPAWTDPRVRTLLALLGFTGFTVFPYAALLPLFARDVFRGGPSTLGLLLASYGLGALAGAIVLAVRSSAPLPPLLVVGRLTLCATLGLFAWSRSLPWAVVLLFLSGLAMIVTVAGTNTFVQQLAPAGHRGRVMAAYTMMLVGPAPLGALAAGWLAARVGPGLTLTMGAVACALVTAAFAKSVATMRLSVSEA
jgi:MFS family permease